MERIAITDTQFRELKEFVDSSKMRKKSKNDMKLLSTILFFTGGRISEALALSVDDLKAGLKKGVLKIPQHKKRGSKKVYRDIPLLGKAKSELKELLKVRIEISGETGYLFHPQGRPQSSPSIDGFTNRFNEFLLIAIKTEESEKITSHSFRYRASSKLFIAGVSETNVSKFLGHHLNSIAVNHYFRLSKGDILAINKKMSRIISSKDKAITSKDIDRMLFAS